MPHRLRCDHPGSWHHVFARGIARRTVFETRRGIRLFRGRFGSRAVTSDIDRLNVIAYIDANAVQAGLAATPEALRYAAIAQRCGTSITEARTCYRQHAARLLEDPSYAAACGSIARATLVTLHRPRPRAR